MSQVCYCPKKSWPLGERVIRPRLPFVCGDFDARIIDLTRLVGLTVVAVEAPEEFDFGAVRIRFSDGSWIGFGPKTDATEHYFDGDPSEPVDKATWSRVVWFGYPFEEDD